MPKRRGSELVLIVLALTISVAAYAIVGLAVTGNWSERIFAYGLGLALLVGAAHVVIRITAPYADPVLLPIITLLNGLGLAMIYRLDLGRAQDAINQGGDPPRADAPIQLTWTAIGVALFVVVLLLIRDHRRLQRATYTSLFAGVFLLLLPLVPGLGVEFQGAQIWVRLGPFGFQPGELAKACLILFFAGYLVVKKDALALAGRRFLWIDLPRARDLFPLLVGWGISMGILVFQQDLGSALLFFGTFVVLLYIATERPGWIVVGLGLFASGSLIAWALFAHVQVRVNVWLHPFDPDVNGFQIIQSLYGMAYGGILGQGLGEGHPGLVPIAKSDFIIAAFGEELGLTGLMAMFVLYGIIVERGLRTALICRDQFGKLLAAGFATVFAIQAFVVIGGVTKLIPLTGLTTPFLSYGGSSLVVNWGLAALLLRISHYARKPATPTVAPSEEDQTQVVMRR